MGKRIFEVYLAKEGIPNNEAYAKLDLPASLWELWDALDKVRLQTDDILYMEIEDYDAFAYLAPHLDGLDISLNELNDLAALLSPLDEVQEAAFEGLFSMEVQRKVNANGGVITLQDLRDLAVSAKTDCYHVVDAADDAQLGRFYAENDFVPELEGISDAVFEMLDFAGIGRMMRCSENGVFVGSLYVLRDGELTTAPSVQKALPEKPGYLFRLTLGLCPDFGGDRTAVLDLPASEEALVAAQEQLGTLNWENTVVLNYDGIIPNVATFCRPTHGNGILQRVYQSGEGHPCPTGATPKAESPAGAVRGAGHRNCPVPDGASGGLHPHAGLEFPAGNCH